MTTRRNSTAMLAMAGLWFLASQPAFGQAKTVQVQANTEWTDTGVDVSAGQFVNISATGGWGGGTHPPRILDPNGVQKVRNASSLAPQAPWLSLVGRVVDNVFPIGTGSRTKASTGGRLFLSMNDVPGQFADNHGEVTATITISSLAGIIGPKVSDKTYFFLKADEAKGLLKGIAFNGGRVQLSQTDEGQPIAIGGFERMSYLSFGPGLAGMGLSDMPLTIPVDEVSTDELAGRNSGGLSDFTQYVVTGGTIFIDNMRFLLNNVHADFDNDLAVELADGEIQLVVKLQSGNPGIRGEGHGFTSVPLGIPLPLGWEDGLAPDINLIDPIVTVHLKPALNANGQLYLLDPDVDMQGDLTLTQFDWLVSNERKDGYKDAFEKQLRAQLKSPQTKAAVENAMVNLLLGGRPNAGVASIKIDSNGIETAFKK